MLRLDLLPAGHGDCLWLTYGTPSRPRRVLIDGGTGGTHRRALRDRLLALPPAQRRFELLVVTHVDADHIAGVLELLADEALGFSARDVWFNGYRHLPDEHPDTLGPVQGERLTALLLRRGLPWNAAFKGAAVVVPDQGPLPRVALPGGLGLTLLSPTPAKLALLRPVWERELRRAGLDPALPPDEPGPTAEGFQLLSAPDVAALAAEPFVEDDAEANGSSIALLAEYKGRRLLLAADAHPGVLLASLRRLVPAGRVAVDACKLPHHGSKANVSPALLQALDCRRWLFSSNGAYFRHPDAQAVARVVLAGGAAPELVFNYRSSFNQAWASPALQQRHGYRARHPDAADGGIQLDLA